MNETIPDRDSILAHADPRFAELFEIANEIVRTHIAPAANSLDHKNRPPLQNVRRLARAGLLGLTTSTQYGGHGAPGMVVRAYTELLAAACGTTTFVQGQHLSACSLIASGENMTLKREALPQFARGKNLIGVAFAHLRRPGPPCMSVVKVDCGYLFNGIAPWFTGWGVFDHVLLAGTLPNGQFIYVVIPLKQGDSLTASKPLEMCVMNASGTVTLKAADLLVPNDRVMKTITPDQMAGNDLSAILGVTPQIFGLTRACAQLVRSLWELRKYELFREAAVSIERELADLRAEADKWRDLQADGEYKQNALRVRSSAIQMGVRAAHIAVTASGGASAAFSHPAQRLFREAMFYTLTAQTRDVQAATLTSLINHGNP